MNTSDTSTPAPTPIPTTHPVGFRFFFWGEFAERFSYYGMRTILPLYMLNVMKIEQADSSTYLSLFFAAVYLLPLLGGYIADNFFGKYWTIVGFSLPYVAGQFLVGFPNDYVFVFALALLAMGSGVIKPNISSLMGMTYDQQRPGQDQLRSDAFSWFYLSINVGALISQLALPMLRDRYGYQVAFMAPAFFMIFALVVFALGKKHYAVETVKATKSVPTAEETVLKMRTLGRILSLFVLVMFFWAIFDQSSITWIYFTDTYTNCNVNLPFYGDYEFSGDGLQFLNALFIIVFVPLSVIMWRYFDRKGIKIKATSKLLVGFILTGICMGIMAKAGYSAGKKREVAVLNLPFGDLYFPKQKIDLASAKHELGSGVVAFGDMNLSFDGIDMKLRECSVDGSDLKFRAGTITTAAGNYVFKEGLLDIDDSSAIAAGNGVSVPGLLLVKSNGEVLKSAQKGWLVYEKDKFEKQEPKPVKAKTGEPESKEDEAKRIAKQKITIAKGEYVPREEQVSVWWQVVAYLILTWAEILVSITGLELAFVIAPASMKSLITACWLVTVGLANLLINAPVTRFYSKMTPGNYFLMLAVMMAVVCVIFIFIARRFNKGLVEQKA